MRSLIQNRDQIMRKLLLNNMKCQVLLLLLVHAFSILLPTMRVSPVLHCSLNILAAELLLALVVVREYLRTMMQSTFLLCEHGSTNRDLQNWVLCSHPASLCMLCRPGGSAGGSA